MRRATGVDGQVENLARLSGGANMESSAFDYAGNAYVLRRAPSAEMMEGRSFGHDVEAALVRAARAAGVKAPVIVAEIAPADDIGTGYIMQRVVAEVSPAKILADPPPSLLADCARELARIHAIPIETSPEREGEPSAAWRKGDNDDVGHEGGRTATGYASGSAVPFGQVLPAPSPALLIAELRRSFVDYGGDRPVFALAFRWLEERLPVPAEPVLLHGDFRMGNIMVDSGGLAAVLDWELAHIGDRHQDLAYGCINSWRFGHIDRPAFGAGSFEALFAAYEAESGIAVDGARFRWWLVYSTLWWGICCLRMAEIWRSGLDAALERAVIGRRTSETEVDLLMLLEEDAPEVEKSAPPAGWGTVEDGLGDFPSDTAPTCGSLHHAPHGSLTPNGQELSRRAGEPSMLEMLEALSAWIDMDIKAKAQGRDKFLAAVALNALGMLRREAENPVAVHDKALSDDLLAGRQSLATPGLLARLKAQSLAKLAADQPKYSALAAATQKWSGN